MRIFLCFLLLPIFAHAKLKVGATTTDLEALAREVGGSSIETFAIAKGSQDPHQIEAKPSYMIKFRGADLVVSHGLDLEAAWLKPLLQGARNPKLADGTAGYLEIGPSIQPIEVSTGPVSRAGGDVHPEGNPHFSLDPIRMGDAAHILAVRLGELDPAHQEEFLANAQKIKNRWATKTKEWRLRLAKTGIKEVVTYHKTLNYFLTRFGIENRLQLEPKPGIPPTAGHILDVIRQMKARKLKLILIENYFDDSIKTKVKAEIPDVRVVRVPVSVGGAPGINSLDDLVEMLVRTIEGVK